MSLKRDFVEMAEREGANFSEVCRRFGVSRPTGYKWLERWKDQGQEGLSNRSRRPKSSPTRTERVMEGKILEVRDENPAWGGRKIRQRLLNLGESNVPAASTVNEILKRNRRLEREDKSPGQAYQRFQRDRPNSLWQMDFKGHFALSEGGRCHPLTALDDHSRYNLVLEACDNEREATVRDILEASFRRYGLPDQILCDNGSPWGAAAEGRACHTGLEVWLMERGVELIHGRPYHPQTQGKEERFHRTLGAEVLSRRTVWRNLRDCSQAFEPFRQKYNYQRPHHSLGGRVPADYYQLSKRQLPEKVPPAESHYDEKDVIKRVLTKGEVHFEKRTFYVGQAFAGKTIAIRPGSGLKWEVFYCWASIGEINLESPPAGKGRYESIR